MKTQPIESFFRFCPHCAAEHADPGKIPFRCSECGFALFFGPVAAVGALVANPEGQILLVRRARDPGKGKWGLPGGFVDRDESIEEAMAREVLEETGLQIVRHQYLMSAPNDYNYRGIVAPVIDLFYACEVRSLEPISLAEDELDDHLWVRPTVAHLDEMAFPSNRRAIEFWLANH